MSEKLIVGSIVEGKIIRIKPFGVIVSLGTAQGLVHISQVSSSFVEDINDYVKVNDIVKVKIVSIDEETRKIALSIRDTLPKEERAPRSEKAFSKPSLGQGHKPKSEAQEFFRPTTGPGVEFEDKMKDWLKQSSERQTTLNKRANKRSY